MEEEILKLIREIGNDAEDIGPEQELWDAGILDSLAFISLLEEKIGRASCRERV